MTRAGPPDRLRDFSRMGLRPIVPSMAWFRRRHASDRFVLLDIFEAPVEPPPSLRRIAAEAVILQDEAEA